MSAAPESQERSDKGGGAKFGKIDINVNLDPRGGSKGRFLKNVILDPSDVQTYVFLHH